MSELSFTSKRTERTFDVDGETFRSHSAPGGLFIDFARNSEGATEAETGEMVYDLFAQIIHEDDFERFWQMCRTTLDLQTMIEIISALTQGAAKRPTVPSSRSARGRGAKAGGASSGPVRALGNSTSASAAT